jgi:hypothetical protein
VRSTVLLLLHDIYTPQHHSRARKCEPLRKRGTTLNLSPKRMRPEQYRMKAAISWPYEWGEPARGGDAKREWARRRTLLESTFTRPRCWLETLRRRGVFRERRPRRALARSRDQTRSDQSLKDDRPPRAGRVAAGQICWIAESSHWLPRRRAKVHSSSASTGRRGSPLTSQSGSPGDRPSRTR